MIVIAAVILGALLGAHRARIRQGTGFDIAQYAAAHAIFFAIIGLILTVIVEKLL
jgi:hypothetical protein